ncbi:hypothetical protein FRB98_007959 [Tulasnella sp. 332]|nr:hypothetical protein FRB98_007959 [Tulasnella sp. 332]
MQSRTHKITTTSKGVDHAQFLAWSSAKATEVILVPEIETSLLAEPPASMVTVSNDILYKIFLLAFEDHPRTIPLVVSHVCRRWRAFALGSPILWTRLIFDRSGVDSFERERVWVSRSNGAPLDIEINGKAFEESGDGAQRVRRMMQVLEPHAGRWRSLRLSNIPNDTFIILGNLLTNMAVPNLETLVVTHRTWRPRNTKWTFRPFQTTGAPQLRRLTLRSTPIEWDSPLFHNLHRLTLGVLGVPWADQVFVASKVYNLLSQSPDLEELIVSSVGGFMGSPPRRKLQPTDDAWSIPPALDGVPSIARPKLTKLFVDSSEVIDTLLQSVQMPALKALPVKYRMTPSMAPIICNNNRLPCLIELTIDTGRDTKAEAAEASRLAFRAEHISMLQELLSTLNSLEELRFENFHFGEGDKWMRCLTGSCPKLKRLTLISCEGLTEQGIYEVVNRRKNAENMQALDVLWILQCRNLASMTEGCVRWFTVNMERFVLSA